MDSIEQTLLGPLNEAQREAVVSTTGPVLVLAGAGSGKTRVITHRLAWLIEKEGLPPDEIMAVTFTNKAAGEMRERARRLLGGDYGFFWIGTFHSLCARILRKEGWRLSFSRRFTIYDSDDQLGIVKAILKEKQLDDKQFPPRQVLSLISKLKNEGKGPDELRRQWAGDAFKEQTASVWREYQARLKKADAMDFDDLLLNTLVVLRDHEEARALWTARFKQVLVDEYQDTNDPQYRFVRALASVHGNLCAVGDEDQSIYGWRGASVGNILRFEKDFPGAKLIRLERNYRSTQTILDAAMAVVSRNKRRLGKSLYTEKNPGDRITAVEAVNGRGEAEWVVSRIERERARRRLSEIAVLYRTNAQSRPFEELLISRSIPYRVVGGLKFYERREIRDLLAYARLALNPADDAAVTRVINIPARGIGATTLGRLQTLALERNVALLPAIQLALNENLLPARAAGPLKGFVEIAAALAIHAETLAPAPFLNAAIEAIRYFDFLESEYKADGDHETRIENVNELIAGAAAFRPTEADGATPREWLSAFLEKYALASDQDQLDEDADAEKLTLMTVHAAKGLEFPVVFIAGLEQTLFPHARAAESEADLEEERRLFYVAVTRARERVYLSRALYRARYGGYEEERERSVFWDEVPKNLLDEISHAQPARAATEYGERARPRFGASPGYASARTGGDSLGNAAAFFGGGSKLPENGFTKNGRPLLAPASSFAKAAEGAPVAKDPLRPGAKVQHAKFGYGIVLFKEGAGDDAFVTVSFSNFGRKKLALRIAGLKYL